MVFLLIALLLLLGFLYLGIRLYRRTGTPVPVGRWIAFVTVGLLLAPLVRGLFNGIKYDPS